MTTTTIMTIGNNDNKIVEMMVSANKRINLQGFERTSQFVMAVIDILFR